MKNILVLFFIIATFCCCKSHQSYYHGYVYSENAPIDAVIINEKNSSIKAYSNKKGYFKLPKKANIVDDLIFTKIGFKKDTVITVWLQYGEKEMKRFLNKTADTINLKVQKN
ncbi:hypothetical protein [Flavobacterium sp.]|uniref:hypothetical protein n=1 Tax=Flavobacterium sp. TaxID=239 RepID=UPI0037503D18